MEWGRWKVGAAVCLALAVAPACSDAVELRRLAAVRAPQGAAVHLELSGRVPVVVRALADGGEGARRLYLDLPAGTRLGTGAAGPPQTAAPVTRLRAGLGDRGVVRVVVDLAEPVTYRLARAGSRVTLEVTPVVGPGVAPEEPPAAPEAGTARAAEARTLVRQARTKIVLDPGHGGHDPGARGYVVEKDVTLALARNLAALLRDRLGAEVILTRTDDVTLPLAERTARANAEGADLFVSIHANASPGGRLHGIETYYLNNSDDHATIRLAAMENGLDLLTPQHTQTDLRYILSDLVQVGKMEESIALAAAVQRGLVGQLRRHYPGVADLGVKQGPFYVLVGAYMPCVLVEASFLDHLLEGRRLAGANYREAVAEGLYGGIARFLADARRARTL